MAFAKYRISRITIEGFRGFTAAQTIEIAGKNTFVFGVNGQGKSSIIEAVRWGLFGSAPGKDIEVRNTFYTAGTSVVTIELTDAGRSIEIKREFRPGATRSRQTIRDSHGNILLEKDVLPLLARIGPQEGTQVIFAAQHATGRQAQVDISDFTRVLCFYMQLEKVPELLRALENLLAERQEEYVSLAKDIEHAEGTIRSDLKQTRDRLDEILRNPPWGEGPSPSGSETDERINILLGDAARTKGTSSPMNESSREKLTRLKSELDHREDQDAGTLQTKIQSAMKQRGTADSLVASLKTAQETGTSLLNEIQNLETRLSTALGGETTEQLNSRFAALERSLTEKDAIASLAATAKKLSLEYGWSQCPLCGTNNSTATTPSSLPNLVDQRIQVLPESLADPSALEDLRARTKDIPLIDQNLSAKKQALHASTQAAEKCDSQLSAVFPSLSRPIEISQATSKINELDRDVEGWKSQLDNKQRDRQQWAKRVKDLDQELVFHEYRDKIQRLETKLTDGLKGGRDLLRQYHDLLATTTSLKNMLEQSFKDALDRATPQLEKMFTEVYQRLTRQPSYDQVRIISLPEQPRQRELRVASSQLPNQTFLPNVLNGQAAKALQLVPYFVFSQFLPEIMELDLLLIDDPSESFDTSHVAELVNELGLAAEHAQLIVATHEREKFKPHLTKSFIKPLPLEVTVEGFSTKEGPKLAIK